MGIKGLCLITGMPPSSILIKKFIDVLKCLNSNIIVITGEFNDLNCNNIVKLKNGKSKGLITSIFNGIMLQLKYSYYVIKFKSDYGIILFYLGGSSFFLPILISRILKKKVVFVVTHSTSKIARRLFPNSLVPRIMLFQEHLNYLLSNRLVVYTPSICTEFGLEGYRYKISFAYEHFVDLTRYKKIKENNLRKYTIGFVGRLSDEKGIKNLVVAMTLVPPEINLLVCGDGELREEIENYIKANDMEHRISLVGWVQQEELPSYYNEMKILVIPSYTEGLVNVMYEAMACGTIVLASSVGAIPDFIIQQETGFLLKSNSPKDIAEAIIKAVSYPRLDIIENNSIQHVKNNFLREKAVERYYELLHTI